MTAVIAPGDVRQLPQLPGGQIPQRQGDGGDKVTRLALGIDVAVTPLLEARVLGPPGEGLRLMQGLLGKALQPVQIGAPGGILGQLCPLLQYQPAELVYP